MAGLDAVSEADLKSCTNQLANFHPLIWNNLLQRPTSKKPSFFWSPRKIVTDHCPKTLTSTIIKCNERLVIAHIYTSLSSNLNSLQYAYRKNRSKGDAISLDLHLALDTLIIRAPMSDAIHCLQLSLHHPNTKEAYP